MATETTATSPEVVEATAADAAATSSDAAGAEAPADDAIPAAATATAAATSEATATTASPQKSSVPADAAVTADATSTTEASAAATPAAAAATDTAAASSEGTLLQQRPKRNVAKVEHYVPGAYEKPPSKRSGKGRGRKSGSRKRKKGGGDDDSDDDDDSEEEDYVDGGDGEDEEMMYDSSSSTDRRRKRSKRSRRSTPTTSRPLSDRLPKRSTRGQIKHYEPENFNKDMLDESGTYDPNTFALKKRGSGGGASRGGTTVKTEDDGDDAAGSPTRKKRTAMKTILTQQRHASPSKLATNIAGKRKRGPYKKSQKDHSSSEQKQSKQKHKPPKSPPKQKLQVKTIMSETLFGSRPRKIGVKRKTKSRQEKYNPFNEKDKDGLPRTSKTVIRSTVVVSKGTKKIIDYYSEESEEEQVIPLPIGKKRGRGRPRKSPSTGTTTTDAISLVNKGGTSPARAATTTTAAATRTTTGFSAAPAAATNEKGVKLLPMERAVKHIGITKRLNKKKIPKSKDEIELEQNTKMVSRNVLICLRDIYRSQNIQDATNSITFLKNVWKTDNVAVLELITKQFYNNQGVLILVLCLKQYYEQSIKFVHVLLDTFYNILQYDTERCLNSLVKFDAVLTVLDAVTYHCYYSKALASAVPKGTFTDTSGDHDLNENDVKFLLSESDDEKEHQNNADREKKNKALQLKCVSFLNLLSKRQKEQREKSHIKEQEVKESEKSITTIMECITFVIRTMKSYPRDMPIQQTCTQYLNAALNKVLGGKKAKDASKEQAGAATTAAVVGEEGGESNDATATATNPAAEDGVDASNDEAKLPPHHHGQSHPHHEEDETSTIKEYLLVQKVDKLLYDAFDLFCGMSQNESRGIDYKELATEALNRLLSTTSNKNSTGDAELVGGSGNVSHSGHIRGEET